VKELIAQYLDSNRGVLEPSTLEAYPLRLRAFADYMGDVPVTPTRCKNWLSKMLTDGASRRTASTYYASVNTMYVALLDMGLVESNPVPKLRRFVVPTVEKRAMTWEDMTAILAQCKADGRRDWFYATLCGWHTGLRLGDVATLKTKEVDFDKSIITRLLGKTKRFGKVVSIPIPKELIAAIRNCPPYPDGGKEYVCPGMAQKYLYDRHKTLSVEFIRLARKAGCSCSFHTSRHARVSTLLNKNVSPAIVRSLTGHSLKQLESYSHISTDAQREALGIP